MVNYLVFLAISVAIFALFSLGLNLQWGYTGLINFGHVAFMTVGAYTTVLLSSQGIPVVMAVVIGAALAALLGLFIGFSTLRLREDYLAIVTIGVSEVIRLVALNEEKLTRGAFGVQDFPLPLANITPNLPARLVMIGLLTLIAGLALWRMWRWIWKREWATGYLDKALRSRPTISSIILGILSSLFGVTIYFVGALALYDYSYKAGLMLLSLIVLAVVIWALEKLVRSPWGRVLKAIREDEQIPRALGKNVFWYKMQAFMLGGAIAGVAGAFYAWQLTTVYPSNFETLVTFNAWIIVVLGGAGNNAGTLLGAVIFWAYDALTRFMLPAIVQSTVVHSIFPAIELLNDERQGAFRIMVIGLILILLMVWRPQGILGKKEELTLGR